MELNRKNILLKTNRGISIFQYVLKQFNPEKIAFTHSRSDYGIKYNPFNEGKKTLSIKLEDNTAIYTDTEWSSFKGDPFDFAKFYFKSQSETELLNKINDVLHLRLKGEVHEKIDWLKNTWRTDCSFFKAPVRNVFPCQTLRLNSIYKLIIGNAYKSITEELRGIEDIKEKRKFKANKFDYVTFSGMFERRNDKFLQKHSNLITIDFDHLVDLYKVREQLLKDPYFDTELLFISPSGDGLKWIIRIDLEEATQTEYFAAISNYIKQTYNVEVDASGKDVSRACFLPHDANAFLHKRHRSL